MKERLYILLRVQTCSSFSRWFLLWKLSSIKSSLSLFPLFLLRTSSHRKHLRAPRRSLPSHARCQLHHRVQSPPVRILIIRAPICVPVRRFESFLVLSDFGDDSLLSVGVPSRFHSEFRLR